MFLTGCDHRWICILMALTGGLVMSRPLQKYSMGPQRFPSKQEPLFGRYVRNLKTRASSAPFSARQASTDVGSHSFAAQSKVQLKPTQHSTSSPSRKKIAMDLSTALIALTIRLAAKSHESPLVSDHFIQKCDVPSSELVPDGVPTDVVVMRDSQFKKKHALYQNWQNLVDPGDFCLEAGPNCRLARLRANNDAKGNR
ncbi:hypothetical protein DFH28DRAFT_985473 [Melampsora americana]|nr:hypothetical protein DFH28DRAFT_985473 [Melampsora americana]